MTLHDLLLSMQGCMRGAPAKEESRAVIAKEFVGRRRGGQFCAIDVANEARISEGHARQVVRYMLDSRMVEVLPFKRGHRYVYRSLL